MLTSKLADLLEIVDQKRSEIVPCLLGEPGIGKTQGIYEFAAKHNRNVVEIIASQIMPSEVSGITMPDQETKSMQIFDHARLASLKDGDILFFDELLQAPQAVLSACLTLIQERRMMSGKKLPDIMIVAAANPLRSPTLIAESIRQRFMFIHLNWDSEAWAEYIFQKYNVRPSNSLIANIQSSDNDGDKWNRLTPRTATKLIAWGKSLGEDQLWLLEETIEQMFNNSHVTRELIKLINPSANEQSEEDNAELITNAINAFCDTVWALADESERVISWTAKKIKHPTDRLLHILSTMVGKGSNRTTVQLLVDHINKTSELDVSMKNFVSMMDTLCLAIDAYYNFAPGKTMDAWNVAMAQTETTL